MNKNGLLSIILHAHLPYVRHPEDKHVLEEEWLYEAITETYIPLIKVFSNLIHDGVNFNLTLSLSPTLISMLTDDLLQQRYLDYLDDLIKLSNKELRRTKNNPELYHLAQMYQQNFLDAKKIWRAYDGNLITAFKKFQTLNLLEIITCPATHGYLPLMKLYPESVKAQIKLGIKTYQQHFDRKPAGIWIPECGYYPEQDQFLWEEGIRYFFTDSHGILNSKPKPHYANFAPIYCPSGVAAFARDLESSKQVWSATEGYPGDYDYREFYRDIGYDLDYDYIKPHLHPEGFRKQTGIKYYRITGEDSHKELYKPHWAKEKAAIHAGNFLFNRQVQVKYLNQQMDRTPIIISPYDAELFGHWWYEGPTWLEFLIRKIAYDQQEISLITPSQYLDKYPINQVATPSQSSWGDAGYNQVWLNQTNDWIYPKLHQNTEKMIDLANKITNPNQLEERTLNQLARELLLAQSSDWAFILKTDTMTEYATRRLNQHFKNFEKLYKQLQQSNINRDYLKELENKNNLFPNLNYKVYQSNKNANYKEVII
ncbi:glycoside hydrolase family 57 protein [Natroniella sp. ANB-PHB2]|uniref:glycoside hydrolase family 57 protein n=1 Tax=Natroniella sp. ANB-PHB2 TaxID=3384444 RepID=UPI0038D4C61C